jgi:hypothetical protein
LDGRDATPQPAATPGVQVETQLTPRQESLREALAARSAEAASLYVGGLRVLADQRNPCSLRLASTAMRELFGELASACGVINLRGGSTKSRINNLRDRVNRASTSLRLDQPPAPNVARLLDLLDEFFQVEDEINPSRKAKAGLVVAAISVATDSPALVVVPQAERLLELSDRFGAMLHGGSRDEFAYVLADFENLLLDLLTPQTFDDYAMIDELVAEGPPDG